MGYARVNWSSGLRDGLDLVESSIVESAYKGFHLRTVVVVAVEKHDGDGTTLNLAVVVDAGTNMADFEALPVGGVVVAVAAVAAVEDDRIPRRQVPSYPSWTCFRVD